MNTSLKKNASLLVGVAICLALLGYYIYLIVSANQSPTASLGAATDPAVGQATALNFDEKTLLEIRQKTLNGNLPITLQPSDLGATQLFGN